MSDKELIKKTLADLKAAKDRMLKGGHEIPYELQRRINIYASGFVKNPRPFENEIRNVVTASVYDDSDAKYDSAVGGFVNANNEVFNAKMAIKINTENDKRRAELGLAQPPYRKRDKLAAVNIILGRKAEYEEPNGKPGPLESIINDTQPNKNNPPTEIIKPSPTFTYQPDLFDYIAEKQRQQDLDQSSKQKEQQEPKENAFDGKGIANKELLILNKAKYGDIEDL